MGEDIKLSVPLDKRGNKFAEFSKFDISSVESYYFGLSVHKETLSKKEVSKRIGFYVTADGMADLITKILISDVKIRHAFFLHAFGTKRRALIDNTMNFMVNVIDSLSANAMNILGDKESKTIRENKDKILLLMASLKLCKEYDGDNGTKDI